MRKKLVLGVIILLLVMVVLAVGSSFVNKAKDSAVARVSDSFVNGMLANRPGDTYSLFSTQAKKAYSRAAWGADTNSMSALFYGKKPSGPSFSNGTNGAKVATYTIQGIDGACTITINLVQQSGDWRVQSFSSHRQANS